MRKFAYAAVFAAAISAPVFAGALIDQSGLAVLGAPSTACPSCDTGTYGTNASDSAQGGRRVQLVGIAHTRTTSGNEGTAGHVVDKIGGTVISTQSGRLG